jgi:hypothetical protein
VRWRQGWDYLLSSVCESQGIIRAYAYDLDIGILLPVHFSCRIEVAVECKNPKAGSRGSQRILTFSYRCRLLSHQHGNRNGTAVPSFLSAVRLYAAKLYAITLLTNCR